MTDNVLQFVHTRTGRVVRARAGSRLAAMLAKSDAYEAEAAPKRRTRKAETAADEGDEE